MDETTTQVSESAVSAAHELRTLFSRLRRRLKETYDTEGLSPSQTSVLGRLNKGGPASISDLASAEGVRHQSMTATLAALDEHGLITRRPDPTDGRRQLISVNKAGREFLDDRRRASEEWLARSLQEHYTERERQTVIKAVALLERITQA